MRRPPLTLRRKRFLAELRAYPGEWLDMANLWLTQVGQHLNTVEIRDAIHALCALGYAEANGTDTAWRYTEQSNA